MYGFGLVENIVHSVICILRHYHTVKGHGDLSSQHKDSLGNKRSVVHLLGPSHLLCTYLHDKTTAPLKYKKNYNNINLKALC